MLGLLIGFIRKQSLLVWGYTALVLAIIGVLLSVRSAGRQAERVENLEFAIKKQRKYAENSANKRPGVGLDKLRQHKF